MKPISAYYKNEKGEQLHLKIVQFLERGGQILAICIYKDEIVAITPSELTVVRYENSDY